MVKKNRQFWNVLNDRFGLVAAAQTISSDRLLSSCGLNRSMQHLHSSTREGDVENEATTKDLLQLRTKKLDVGSLAER
jgi:hypothetical protein